METPLSDSEQRVLDIAVNLNRKLKEDVDNAESELPNLVVKEVFSRIELYLNSTEVSSNLERIIARIVASAYTATVELITEGHEQREVLKLSDNGQAITYQHTSKQYLKSRDDDELFLGFEALLRPYRRLTTNVDTR